MRGLRWTVLFGVSATIASSAVLLAFGAYFLTREDWPLGVAMILGALVSVLAGIGVLRGFRPLIGKSPDESDPGRRQDRPE